MNSPEELMEERAPSRASHRSHWSADRPIDFKGLGNSMKTDRPSSPSCASERSGWSADRPIDFRRGEDVEAASVRTGRPNSPGSASERSGWSEERPIDFRGAKNLETVSVTGRSVGDSGIVSERSSMTSDLSQGLTLNLSHEEHTENPRCAEPGDVVCDLCEGRKSRAYKSCMTCLASFCERHIRDHYTVEPLQRHLLVEVTKNLNILQENAQLRKENTNLKEELRTLREKNKALNQKIHELRLPDYICKGKIPASGE
ncbi:hypothetical protein NFI96_005918 [Prochilodus magdalenae]|nr:hypothetical protein NFI96_005918 [Prochilodus magdalenae]